MRPALSRYFEVSLVRLRPAGFTDLLSEFGEACSAERALLLGEPTPAAEIE